MRTALFSVPLLLCFLGCGSAERDAAAPAASLPNVVLILADTLRADRLGVYGHRGALTPNLDSIAQEGAWVERAISQAPWTQPSIASLFSSLHPGAHRVLSYRTALEAAYLGKPMLRVFDSSFVTLPEVLSEAGFRTAAFVANPFVAREFGFGQGFDHFDESFAMNTTPGSRVNEAALAWLDANEARPFFLYLHYMDPHGPYDAEARFLDPLLDVVEAMPKKRELDETEYQRLDYLLRPPSQTQYLARHRALQRYREYWVARYDAGVAQLDHHVGALRAALRERGLWEDAYVIVTSDHGEALLEHEFWDHGFSVDHAEVHVPLLLRWPRAIVPGSRLSDLARLIDVMPTLVDHLGLPPVAEVQGVSLVPRLEGGGSAAATPWALTEAVKAGPERKAVYRGRYKLMRSDEGADRLIDRVADPEEAGDVTVTAAEEVEALAELLHRQLQDNEDRAGDTEAQMRSISGQLRRRLEALGYLGGH